MSIGHLASISAEIETSACRSDGTLRLKYCSQDVQSALNVRRRCDPVALGKQLEIGVLLLTSRLVVRCRSVSERVGHGGAERGVECIVH